MILKELIQFKPRKTVYIQINYTSLSKGRSFIITAIYPTVAYIILNNNILKIAIFTNLTKKRLEFNKNTQLKTIYKYIDTTYIIADISKVFVIMTTTSSILLDPFSTVQKKTIFNNKYQNVNLII